MLLFVFDASLLSYCFICFLSLLSFTWVCIGVHCWFSVSVCSPWLSFLYPHIYCCRQALPKPSIGLFSPVLPVIHACISRGIECFQNLPLGCLACDSCVHIAGNGMFLGYSCRQCSHPPDIMLLGV